MNNGRVFLSRFSQSFPFLRLSSKLNVSKYPFTLILRNCDQISSDAYVDKSPS